MLWKNVLYNSVTVSLPKNFIQFLLGIILFWVILGTPDFYISAIAFSAFVIAYSSVYLFNDAMDAEEDRKDKDKSKWKLVASGAMGKKTALKSAVAMCIIGLSMSLLVNRWFFMLNAGLIFLNFLHSSPYTKFKRSMKKTTVNMTLIEFIKFSLGWFALTSNIAYFPFWIIFGLALAYTVSYIFYKFKLNRSEIRRYKKIFVGIGILLGASYLFSFIFYEFPLSLIMLIFLPAVLLLFIKSLKINYKSFRSMFLIEYLLLPLIIISFIILINPAAASLNKDISTGINMYAKNLTENIPDNITEPIKNVSGIMPSTLDDIGEKIYENLRPDT